MGNDGHVISKVKAEIVNGTHIDLVKTPIDFKIEDGTLVMDGMVGSILVKRKAVWIAMESKKQVIDRLRVKPANQMGDLEIATHVQEAIGQDYTLEGADIDIQVSEGAVYLEGEVHSLVHKRLAEVLAWWVPGTINVNNNLRVMPHENDSDDEITDVVKLVFEKDKLVNSGNVLVKTRNSVVTLTGLVRSTAAKEAAEEDVWYVSGVHNVVNKLEIEK